jgi:flavodoxin
MKALVIYDSVFGNTEKIARAIASGLGEQDQVGVFQVDNVTPAHLEGIELIVVGSPTRGFRPTKGITQFTSHLPAKRLNQVNAAAFDTRIRITDVNSAFLTFMVNIFGYAAQPIADGLKKKGGKLIAEPEGFYVEDKEGPLFLGELDRAEEWARQLMTNNHPAL